MDETPEERIRKRYPGLLDGETAEAPSPDEHIAKLEEIKQRQRERVGRTRYASLQREIRQTERAQTRGDSVTPASADVAAESATETPAPRNTRPSDRKDPTPGDVPDRLPTVDDYREFLSLKKQHGL